MGRRLRTLSRRKAQNGYHNGHGNGHTAERRTKLNNTQRCLVFSYLLIILIRVFSIKNSHQENGEMLSAMREQAYKESLSYRPPVLHRDGGGGGSSNNNDKNNDKNNNDNHGDENDLVVVADAAAIANTKKQSQHWRKKWWRGKTWWRGKGPDGSHPHLGARLYTNEAVEVPVVDDPKNQHSGNGISGGGVGGGEVQKLYRRKENLHMIVDPSTDRLHSSYEGHGQHRLYLKPQGNTIPMAKLCPKHVIGREGETGYHVLQRLGRGLDQLAETRRKSPPRRRSKILCMVYSTYETEGPNPIVAAIAETWAPRCDGFWAATNYTNHTIGAIDLPFPQPATSGGGGGGGGADDETDSYLWQKVRAMWGYAHDHYLEEYDFFHITRDSTYLIVDNLRSFLDGPQVERLENGHLDEISMHPNHRAGAKKWIQNTTTPGETHPPSTPGGEIERPLFFGLPSPHQETVVPARGTGYTLNRAALRLLGSEGGLDAWHRTLADAREGVLVSSYFGSKQVYLSHVLDETSRSWLFGQGADLMGRWKSSSIRMNNPRYIWDNYGLRSKDRMDAVGPNFAAFHLSMEILRLERDREGETFSRYERREILAELVHRYHALLYFLC